MKFGMKLVTLKHKLKAQANGKPKDGPTKDLQDQVCGLGLCDLGSLWHEARMEEVVIYLRGNKRLCLPEWARPLLPTEI